MNAVDKVNSMSVVRIALANIRIPKTPDESVDLACAAIRVRQAVAERRSFASRMLPARLSVARKGCGSAKSVLSRQCVGDRGIFRLSRRHSSGARNGKDNGAGSADQRISDQR